MSTRRGGLAALLVLGLGCGRGSEARPPERTRLDARVAGCAAVRSGPVCEVPPEGTTLRFWLPGEPTATDAVTVTLDGVAVSATAVGAPERAMSATGAGPAAMGATNAGPAATGATGSTVPIQPARSTVTAPAGGQRLTVVIPAASEGTGRALEVCAGGGGRVACRTLATQVVARDPQLQRAGTRRAANDLEGALATLARIDGPEANLARAGSLKARVALARGQTEIAVAGLRDGLDAHLAAGRVSDGVADGLALAHTLVTKQHAFARALAVIERVAEAALAWDEGAAHVDYYRALALRDGGRPREALAALERSAARAAELGLMRLHRDARQVEARLLQSLGHHTEAMRTFAELTAGLGADESPCGRAELLSARGWSELSALLAGALSQAPPELRARLGESRRLFEEACPRPAEADSATVNLALEALLAGELERAATLARSLETPGRPRAAYVEVWRLDLLGRIALGANQPREALAAYDTLVERARAALSPEPLLRGLLGRGRALAALGSRDAAVRAFEEAEALLDAELGQLPAGEERALFLDEQGAAASALVELFAASGREAAALAAARRARSRNVRAALRPERATAVLPGERARFDAALARYRAARASLAEDEERAWQRPKEADRAGRAAREAALRTAREALDEAFAIAGEAPSPPLPPPRLSPGEVWLVLQPQGERLCRVLAVTAAGTRSFVARVAPSDPNEALAAALLGPLEATLAEARRVRVLAAGAWQAVDIHALPFRGRPLIAQAVVVYALDLPLAPDSGTATPQTALVVANPEEDLPATEREAAGAAEQLRRTAEVVALSGRGATKKAFSVALGRASWLHFAGHGRYAAGWETGLRLAEGVVFTVRDVLALPQAPAHVVLSGCETARSVPTRALDLGLPEAFVVRGAEQVVAATRPVADATAADLMASLYANPPTSPSAPTDLAEALARAQRQAWERGHRGDWAAYRAIVR